MDVGCPSDVLHNRRLALDSSDPRGFSRDLFQPFGDSPVAITIALGGVPICNLCWFGDAVQVCFCVGARYRSSVAVRPTAVEGSGRLCHSWHRLFCWTVLSLFTARTWYVVANLCSKSRDYRRQ